MTTSFRLRDRTVIPERNLVAGPDGETGIEPKIMAVLCVLAAEPGRVFTRAELIDRVWGTEYGADESLTRAISHLRKALGDTRAEPLVIETIAKRGYRLLPAAVTADAPQPPAPVARKVPVRRAWIIGGAGAAILLGLGLWLAPFAAMPDGITVLVEPVVAVRRQAPQISLASALTVDLVGLLAKDKRLHVTVQRPASSAHLDQRYSIYADLQLAGGQVKTHVEIMNLDTGRALWSRLYERAYDGGLAAQDRLAAEIARDLRPALLGLAKNQAR
jgi:DNA-binding winged helix-turn-helix (wHTH) protein/TolB-like protein